MHPSTTWAGVDAAKLFESFAAVIAALKPTTLIWSIVLVIVIAVAVILTMKMFVIQTPGKEARHHQAGRGAAAAVTKAVVMPA
jgi:low affinity Fe/Cu permease